MPCFVTFSSRNLGVVLYHSGMYWLAGLGVNKKFSAFALWGINCIFCAI
jgi:hypothetical protein